MGDFMRESDDANVILDTHPYQCFTDDDRKRNLHQQIVVALWTERGSSMRCMPVSLHRGRVVLWASTESLEGRTGFALDVAMRAYADAQLINFDSTRGWFFWTYKTQEGRVELPRLRTARLGCQTSMACKEATARMSLSGVCATSDHCRCRQSASRLSFTTRAEPSLPECPWPSARSRHGSPLRGDIPGPRA